MGLLDGFGDFIKTPEGQGLLSAAFGGLAGARRGAPFNSLGNAGLAGLQGYAGAQDRDMKIAQEAQMGKYRQAQIDNYQSEVEQRKAAGLMQAKKDAAMANPWTTPAPTQGTFSIPESNGVEMFSQGAKVETPSTQSKPVLNVPALLAARVSPAEIEALSKLDNLGKQEVARTIKGVGPDGKEYEYQIDKYGQKIGDGFGQFRAPIEMGLGDKKQMLDPYTLQPKASFAMGQSPDSKASNALGWANFGLSKDRLNFDKAGGNDVKPKLVGDQWVTAPSNMAPGQVVSAFPSVAKKDAQEALQLIQTAKEIIPKSTGSYLGVGVDQAARVFGSSTSGDTAAAQLRALEGALVSKMPKMSGPQSDKDVLLYKQMAGEIGNPTIPQSRKMAALQVIEEIQNRHAGNPAASNSGATGGWSMEKVR